MENENDQYAVAVVRDRTTVGHVPRKISAACPLFLQKGGSIHCIVTGERCYSRNLPQGGLEVPCVLKFKGQPKVVSKLKKLVTPADRNSGGISEVVQQPTKKRKVDLNPTITIDDKMNEDKDEDEDGASVLQQHTNIGTSSSAHL